MKKKYLGLKQQFLLLSLCSGSLMASPCYCGLPVSSSIANTAKVLPAVTALPELLSGNPEDHMINISKDLAKSTTNHTELAQNAPKAVINWQTFNIGSQASVNFNQQGNASWSALNVIHDASPSQILGKLNADGKVYLINQNGIFFGPSAQVNVHSLTASSLNFAPYIGSTENLTESEKKLTKPELSFYTGYTNPNAYTITFKYDNGIVGSPEASVENRGTIKAANGGQVTLIGGSVLNSGTITTSQGTVSLAAGNEVKIKDDNESLYPTITSTGTGTVTNIKVTDSEPGLLQVDGGRIGLYGGIVNQEGRAIATTVLERNGTIELKGSTSVTTGAGSLTATPVSTSTQRQTPSEKPPEGRVTIETNEFIHKGAISSLGGTVTVNSSAKPADKIELATGSSIDVSGLWVDQTAEDRILQVQLNSDVLKDAYALKNGLLQGENVTIDILSGFDAADIAAYLKKRERSVSEQMIDGGTVELNAKSVELAPDSRISFSGGGYNFSAGSLDLTKVRVGNKIYKLSELPLGTPVDEVLGSFTRSHDRYGIKQTWLGRYYGGIMPFFESSPAFRWGGDAGTLTINANYVHMAGILDGIALTGMYQDKTEDQLNDNNELLALGRRIPTGGVLNIGSANTNTSFKTSEAITDTPSTYEISITTEIAALDNSSSRNKISIIPDFIINNAGLSSINLGALTAFTIEEGVNLQLAPGGSFSASARQVNVNGSIRAAGGSINLVTASNKSSFSSIISSDDNPDYIPLKEELVISGTSVLNTDGEKITNTGLTTPRYGFTKGGSITLMNMSACQDGTAVMENPDHTYSLTVSEGARLSVQGGYLIESDGSMESADAGSLVIQQLIDEKSSDYLPEDRTLTINGELLGHAFLGGNGGSLSIEACRIAVFPAGGTPSSTSNFPDLSDRFVIADNRFSRTGFSEINLNAYEDITVTSGSLLQPSTLRLVKPGGLFSTSSSLMAAFPTETGSTSINLNSVKGSVTVEDGASITVAPLGEISLNAGKLASIGGTLEAPSGVIDITGSDVTISGSSKILATGVNLLNVGGIGPWNDESWRILDGGSVTIKSTGYGKDDRLFVETGSQIDVSGSEVVINSVKDSLGNIIRRSEAGRPGTIEFSFVNNLQLDGFLIADSFLPGLTGGALKITRENSTKSLTVNEALSQSLQIKGFDDLQLASVFGIEFSAPLSLASSRRFVIDAPRIIGTTGAVTVEAPWVQLVNEQSNYAGTTPAANAGDPVLTVNAQSLDVKGNIQISGFSSTSLNAANAIRLSDVFYKDSSPRKFSGELNAAGDLTLCAGVIYPTTGSIFTIKGSGLISILPQETPYTSPVYSAGGDLTIQGHDIYHAGYLAAPMGKLKLQADNGRILLAPDSRLSVSGESEITYGTIVDGEWLIPNHKTGVNATDTTIMTVPEPSIIVDGKEVILTEGSLIEADGGGTLVAREFLKGFDGTTNPLDPKKYKNRLVIIPDNSIVLPDLNQIYIEGYASLGLEAGIYSILPAEYAFLPGAIILERSSKEAFSGQGTFNLLNQPIVAGYETAYGSGAVPAAMTGYVVRSATDVLKEGYFDQQIQAMANGGDITVNGKTAMILGTMTATGAENGKNGGLTIAGTNIFYENVPAAFQAVQTMFGALPQGTTGNVYFDTHLLNSGTKLGRITLGDYNATQKVTFAENMSFSGIPLVEIKAKKITLETGAEIEALTTGTDEGVISLTTDDLLTKTGSLLHASDELAFNVKKWDFQGDWQVDDGRIRLVSDLISIASNANLNVGSNNGLFMTQAMLNAFTTVQELIFDTKTIKFLDSIDLTTDGDLILDTQQMIASSLPDTSSTVTIKADSLRLKNSKIPLSSTVPLATVAHNLELDAQSFILGPGTVRLDGFTNVSFVADGDMLFAGKGALTANLPENTGILAMTAAGFFASYPDLGDDEVLGANSFAISSGSGDVFLNKNGETSTRGVPGSLSVTGDSVTLDGALLDFPGGRIELTATGTGADDAVTLKNGAAIKAQGGIREYALKLPDEDAIMRFKLAAGEVLLSAASCGIVFGDADDAAGSNSIDVTATDGMDGGLLTITAPSAPPDTLDLSRVSLLGSGGAGGDFNLTIRALGNLGSLASVLQAGGFTDEIRIRARENDMSLGAGETLTARSIYLAADGADSVKNTNGEIVTQKGNINIKGKLDASGDSGGKVTIYAKGDLTLVEGGIIDAKGSAGDGGEVILGSENGFVRTEKGSKIDVAEGTSKTGGSVTYRVDVTGTMVEEKFVAEGANLVAEGEVIGAKEKRLQAVKTYTPKKKQIAIEEIDDWATTSYDIGTNLAKKFKSEKLTIIPEIEVTNQGDLLLKDLSSFAELNTWRPGRLPGDDPYTTADDLPGVLTFRAGGNLNVETSIIDSPTAPDPNGIKVIKVNGEKDSWSLNFVAGADFTAADPLTVSSAGNLTIGTKSDNQIVVFTESGDINLAGHDIIIKPANTTFNFMPGVATYTIATFDGDIFGHAQRDLDLRNGGVLQTAMGNIHLEVGRNLLLANITDSGTASGAIRTTGRMPTWEESGNNLKEMYPDDPDFWNWLRAEQFWLYRDGGNISAKVYGDVTGIIISEISKDITGNGWVNGYQDFAPEAYPTGFPTKEDKTYEDAYRWSANYGVSLGNLYGDTAIPTHGIVTMGGGDVSVTAGAKFVAQTGSFSSITPGNLTISSRGELDGRFIAMSGEAFLSTLSSFGISTSGVPAKDIQTIISMGDTSLTVQALGNVEIDSISNPTIANVVSNDRYISRMTYTTDSSAQLTAVRGSTILRGFDNTSAVYNILPATLSISSGQDISFTKSNTFVMAPAENGNLNLLAGRDINGTLIKKAEPENNSFTSLVMSDASLDVYTTLTNNTGGIANRLIREHNNEALHIKDDKPVTIEAGGNISNINFALAKQSEIIAGHDISNIIYAGQHVSKNDYSMIMAGNNIDQSDVVGLVSPDKDNPFKGFTQAGPGSFLLLAGNNIDLADSHGVQSIGNTMNPVLQDSTLPASDSGRIKGSDVTIISGYKLIPTQEELKGFVTDIKGKTLLYSIAKNISDAEDKEKALTLRDFLAGETTYNEAWYLFFLDKENEQKANKELRGILEQFSETPTSKRFKSWKDENENKLKNITNPAALIVDWIKNDTREYSFKAFLNGYETDNNDVLVTGKITGNLNMTSSAVQTLSGEDSINIFAAGDINVGTTSFEKHSKNTGILSIGGGAINIFAENDINVNESRIMTFLGNDIVILSDTGDINAGRGSKATVISSTGNIVRDPNGEKMYIFTPPTNGSGLRAMTYDPDGTGMNEPPEPGSMFVVTFDGVVDAGEAGIEGGALFLAANQVLNAQNISVGVGSVGMPAASGATASLGALTGDSMAATESTTSDIAKNTAGAGDKMADTAKKIADTISQLRFFVVKFLGFME